jgi:hypothetical protein
MRLPSLVTQPNEDVGNRNAWDRLLDVVSDLREHLMGGLGINLLESVELQYLHYPAGTNHDNGGDSGTRKKKDGGNCNGTRTSGFYWRHFDRTGDEDGPLVRRVSLSLYLNNDGWDANRDGGYCAPMYGRQGRGMAAVSKTTKTTTIHDAVSTAMSAYASWTSYPRAESWCCLIPRPSSTRCSQHGWKGASIMTSPRKSVGGGGEWKGGEVQTGYAPGKKKRKKTLTAKRGRPSIGIK